MKNYFVLFLFIFTLFSCNKDEIIEQIPKDSISSTQEPPQYRYSQEDCGFIENFCSKKYLRLPTAAIPFSIDKTQFDNLGITVNTGRNADNPTNYTVIPAILFDKSVGLVVSDGNETYFAHRGTNSLLNRVRADISIPSQLSRLMEVEYRDISNINTVIQDIETQLRVSVNQDVPNTGSGIININEIEGDTNTPVALALDCDYYRISDVDNFIDVFFEEGEESHIEQFVIDAFESCPIEDYSDNNPDNCYTECINPRCVVDYLLNIDAGLSDYQKRVLASRYLKETLGLTDDEQNWLTFNAQSDLVYEIYNGLENTQNLGRCNDEDCGLIGGYHEIIQLSYEGVNLTTEDKQSALEFFSLLKCDNPTLYDCFRERQENPVSGNRQFGITENSDGTYTFYTSGVDRTTGWWHLVAGNLPFNEAEELWKCFLDQIKIFVESNGGSVSLDYDCTNVRPDLEALQELLKDGCDEEAPSIPSNFPCHQSSECL